MRLTKTASGKTTIKMSRQEWSDMGKKAGWISKRAMDSDDPIVENIITEEMKKFFYERTKAHIESVKGYCRKIENYDPERFRGLSARGESHDQSKYCDLELDPYIWLTWKFKCKDDNRDFSGPPDMDDKICEAIKHHKGQNRHHPEYFNGDTNKMSTIDIGEMVADWCAVSEEKGTSLEEWARKNVNVKWVFTKEQESIIYELIKEVF